MNEKDKKLYMAKGSYYDEYLLLRKLDNFWTLEHGSDYTLIGGACIFAGMCETRELSLKGIYVTPEIYLERFRQFLDETTTLPIDDVFKSFEFIALPTVEEDKVSKYNIDNFNSIKNKSITNFSDLKIAMMLESYECISIKINPLFTEIEPEVLAWQDIFQKVKV
jgi:hypothetical protein